RPLSFRLCPHPVERSPMTATTAILDLHTRPGERITRLGSDDLYLFNEGSHFRLYDKLGAHPQPGGVYFAVWAPAAEEVSIIGDVNGWNRALHHLEPRQNSGIWEGFVPHIGPGTVYKYHIASRYNGFRGDN